MNGRNQKRLKSIVAGCISVAMLIPMIKALDSSINTSGEFNVYRCDYANLITNFWYTWDTTPYISKIDPSSNFYKVTPYDMDDSADICASLGWKKP